MGFTESPICFKKYTNGANSSPLQSEIYIFTYQLTSIEANKKGRIKDYFAPLCCTKYNTSWWNQTKAISTHCDDLKVFNDVDFILRAHDLCCSKIY